MLQYDGHFAPVYLDAVAGRTRAPFQMLCRLWGVIHATDQTALSGEALAIALPALQAVGLSGPDCKFSQPLSMAIFRHFLS